MIAQEKVIYCFGAFELEPAERRLSSGNRSVALTPKVFDTLVLLVERAGSVISKDELMQAVWPRGYVDESNLAKHIWLIRRALGEGEHDTHFIETVPKIGYRFVARVSRTTRLAQGVPGPQRLAVESVLPGLAHPAPDQIADPAATAPGVPIAAAPVAAAEAPFAMSGGSAGQVSADPSVRETVFTQVNNVNRWRVGYALALVACGVIAALGFGWHLDHLRATTVRYERGSTVAFVGFSNLSGNAKDAWLAPALSEMLGVELSVADSLVIVPDELVRAAGSGLSPPAAGGYSAATLKRLRQQLGADYIVSGSYLVSMGTEDSPLRVDIALQDARSGTLLASISNQAPLSMLMSLVMRSGSTMRSKIGGPVAEPATLDLVARTQPPSVDVARHMGYALEAQRHYDAARARDELLESIAEAPDYAPAYAYLSEAWTALGYRDKAIAAAEQAASKAANLAPEQRLQTQAVLSGVRGHWAEAAQGWLALARLRPENRDYRLHSFEAQIAAGATHDAQATLRDLQQLPSAAEDVRVVLAACQLATAMRDARGAQQQASRALSLAHQHDAAGLIADAEVALGGARTLVQENQAALANFDAAIADYRNIHNPRGEAAARVLLAQALGNLNRSQDAREQYQRGMALYQSIGDLAGTADVYRDLSSVLWSQGDRDGAKAAARHALAIARETGDLSLQSWTLQALATIASDDEAGDEALAEYREALAVDERAGHEGSWVMANIADVQRLRGELAAASETCKRAQQLASRLTDAQYAVFSGFTCALIEIDLGHEADARGTLEEVLQKVGTGGDTTYRNQALQSLAELDMDHGRFAIARDRLLEASRGFAEADEPVGEANARALLGLCEHALGNSSAGDRALDRARTLRRSINSRQEVYAVDIVLLQQSARADYGRAVEKLLAFAADAERRHFVGWMLEAKLSAWSILEAHGTREARALGQEIDRTSRVLGFGRIYRKLHSAGLRS